MSETSPIFIFLVCITCGIASGIIYDAGYLVRTFFRARIITIVTDVCFFLFFALLYVFLSLTFGLPNVRAYMLFGCLFGLFLYVKSFHGIVAFFSKKVYNRFIHTKQREKRIYAESGREDETYHSRGDRRGRRTSRISSHRHDLSIRSHRRAFGGEKTAHRRNQRTRTRD
ncbi:MAG: spore cortex biosynthesis protein YabQ [Clostridia bacterium]|nr:spore cortex biosynthesis protein YabQ [Clostridia bacterium]